MSSRSWTCLKCHAWTSARFDSCYGCRAPRPTVTSTKWSQGKQGGPSAVAPPTWGEINELKKKIDALQQRPLVAPRRSAGLPRARDFEMLLERAHALAWQCAESDSDDDTPITSGFLRGGADSVTLPVNTRRKISGKGKDSKSFVWIVIFHMFKEGEMPIPLGTVMKPSKDMRFLNPHARDTAIDYDETGGSLFMLRVGKEDVRSAVTEIENRYRFAVDQDSRREASGPTAARATERRARICKMISTRQMSFQMTGLHRTTIRPLSIGFFRLRLMFAMSRTVTSSSV